MEKELLIKYLNNKCTETELSEVLHWINADALNEKSKMWAIKDWNSFQETDNLEEDEKFTALFDKIQEKIDLGNSNATIKTITLPVVVNWITRAAAILLLPVLTLLFYTQSEKRNISDLFAKRAVDSLEVIAPLGSRTVVQFIRWFSGSFKLWQQNKISAVFFRRYSESGSYR